MRKLLILGLVWLLLVGTSAYAIYPACSSNLNLGENCTFVTSALLCSSLTYDIVNLSGVEVVNNGTLFLLNNSIYYFNYTTNTERGDFIVHLCDGTTSQIEVGGGNVTPLLLVAALPILMSFIFLGVSALLSREEHAFLRMILINASILMVFPALSFGFVFQNELLGSSALDSSMSDFLKVMIGLAFVVLAYFFYYLIIKYISSIGKSKAEKLEY